MSLYEALKNVTQKDLDEVTAAIENLTRDLEQQRELRKLIEIKLGVKRAHGGRRVRAQVEPVEGSPVSGKTAAAAVDEPKRPLTAIDKYRQQVKEYLMANGPQLQAKICKDCKIPLGSITAVLNFAWFAKTDRGVELTGKAYL